MSLRSGDMSLFVPIIIMVRRPGRQTGKGGLDDLFEEPNRCKFLRPEVRGLLKSPYRGLGTKP